MSDEDIVVESGRGRGMIQFTVKWISRLKVTRTKESQVKRVVLDAAKFLGSAP